MASLETFHDHIKELRRRILWIVLAIGFSAGIAYVLRMRLIVYLQRPLGAPLFYTSPAGSFNFILKLSTLIGIFVALPVIIYNLLRFIEPALPITIKRRAMLTVISASFSLALAGIAFSYFCLLPLSLHFFSSYASAQIKPLISANEYLSFMMGHLITFALVFQIPLVVLFINWIKPIKPGKLLRYQRHIIVGSFGLAVILPFTYDPISQFIVAVPIVVLFYLSIILLWIANRKLVYPEDVQPEITVLKSVPTPYLAPTPLPVMSAALPVKRYFAIDGFVTKSVPPAAFTYKPEPTQPVVTTQPSPASQIRPKLAIDGISPPLPSYS